LGSAVRAALAPPGSFSANWNPTRLFRSPRRRRRSQRR
jgi:hypothetical protein